MLSLKKERLSCACCRSWRFVTSTATRHKDMKLTNKAYDILKWIAMYLLPAAGTLYLILKRLRDEEYVETYLVEAGEGPARKYYHLTVKGWAYQEQLKKEWFDFTAAVERLIVSKESK